MRLALALLLLSSPAFATWKPEYASAPQDVQDRYRQAQLTEAAQKRFAFKSCCAHADVVKTQFRVNKSNGQDEWYWLNPASGQYQRIPPDIIHWGASAPGGQPTLFVIGADPVCFWPPDGGI